MAASATSTLDGHNLQPGQMLGAYRIVERLGEGGMGVVFKALEVSVNRHVALKVLRSPLTADHRFVERFLQEARTMAQLDHPNIVRLYSAGEQDGLVFFAMEFIEGKSLQTLLERRKQIEESEALGAVYQAALALQYAQSRGVVHRDIKPANLLVTADGVVKVADFGLAKLLFDEQSLQLTSTQLIIGSPYYISPEQARGEKVDHRSDIYSLGATLYHLLAGRPPFMADTAMGVLLQHVQDPLPPIQKFNPTVSPGLNQILAKAMAKQPAARYQTYQELLAVLRSPPRHRRPLAMILGAAALLALVLNALFSGGMQSNSKPSSNGPPSVPSAAQKVDAPVKSALPAPVPAIAASWQPLDFSAVMNADIIHTAQHPAADEFDLTAHQSLPAAGLPGDGRLAIPRSRPSGFFHLRLTGGRNALLLSDRAGRHPGAVTFTVPAEQRRRYSQLAFLHAATCGDCLVNVLVRYTDGHENSHKLKVVNWDPRTRPHQLTDDQVIALTLQPPGFQQPAELFAQTLTLDAGRVLQSLTFSLDLWKPAQGLSVEDAASRLTAAILAISGNPAGE